MNKIAAVSLCVLLLFLLAGSAQAYVVKFEVPSEINRGQDLYISGTSNIRPGATLNADLYTMEMQSKFIDSYPFTIQGDGDWKLTVPTSKLPAGRYKLEVEGTTDIPLGSSSTSYAPFTILDRTGEIIILSKLSQASSNSLDVEGRSTTRGSAGIQIEVEDSEGTTIYPATWISTDTSGIFKENVPVPKAGRYTVKFSDTKGVVSVQDFLLTGAAAPTAYPTSTPAAVPTYTAPASPIEMSFQSFTSNDSPAYFAVNTNSGKLNVRTSGGHDWIIEYRDGSGTITKINEISGAGSESFSMNADGGMVYLKVYPADVSDSGYVTVYTTGASSIIASADAASYFASASENSQQSGAGMPLSLVLCISALAMAVFASRRV